MIRAPRLPRPSRPVLLTILVTAVLAFPMGIVLASHQFSDVPNSNPFHNDIDALVDSGVTAGCGGGKYCPKSAVTREQMAAFLNRLGALAPGKTPVVNADRGRRHRQREPQLPSGVLPGGRTIRGTFADPRSRRSTHGRASHTISFPVTAARGSDALTTFHRRRGRPWRDALVLRVRSTAASAGHLCVFEIRRHRTTASFRLRHSTRSAFAL